MPRVPTYDNPQVEARPLPGFRQESVATPALLGGAFDSVAQASKGLSDVGTGLAAVAYNMQERENADKVFQAETTLKAQYLDYEASVRDTKKGAFSKGVTVETKAWWDEVGKKHVEGLDNDVQRKMFAKRMSGLRLQSLHNVSQFEAQQTEISHDASWQANKVGSIDIAAAHANEETTAAQMGELRRLNAYQGARKGWDAATLSAVNSEDITKLHQQVIQTLAKDNPAAAQSYFEAHKNEIRGSLRAEIGNFAKTATAETVGDGVAATVWAKYRPENSVDPIKTSDAEDDIRKDPAVKNNPTALKAALAGFEHRAKALTAQRHAESVSGVARVEELVIKGVRGPALSSSPQFVALSAADPRAANAIRVSAENEDYNAAIRAERKLNVEGLDKMLELSDPDVLVSKTRDEIVALRTTIGTQNTLQLVQRHDALTKSAESLAAARIDNNTFKALAIGAGLRPDEKSPSEANKDRLVQLRAAVDSRLALEARAKGKPLSPEEKVKFSQQAFDDTVRVPGFFSINSYGTGTDLPASALTRSERDKAFVILPGGRVRIKDIPPAFVSEAEGSLARARRPVTQKAVAEMWLLNKDKWGKTVGEGAY